MKNMTDKLQAKAWRRELKELKRKLRHTPVALNTESLENEIEVLAEKLAWAKLLDPEQS
jgi:hypothetical protein